jgi:RHS repeat-associated protein
MADDPCQAAFSWADPTGPRNYYRARYYDPKLGRFISEDPIAFFGGMNFYSYVNNNPANLIDPFGHAPCCPSTEEPEIRLSMANIHRRLDNLAKNGTAVLPEELAAGSVTAGGVSGCASNGQYFVTINPDLSPCIRKCVIFHEKIHERQCGTFGPQRFAGLSERESETPAYMNELGCLVSHQAPEGGRTLPVSQN